MLKVDREAEVGYFAKPSQLYVLTASNLVDGAFYSERLNVSDSDSI